MEKFIIPSSSTGFYADARMTGRIITGIGALATLGGAGKIIEGNDPINGVICGVVGVGIGIFGRDICKAADNLEKYYNFPVHITLTGKVDAKNVAEKTFEGTTFKKVYMDCASLRTRNFTAIEVLLGAEPDHNTRKRR